MLASLETALSVIPKACRCRLYSSSAVINKKFPGVKRVTPVRIENKKKHRNFEQEQIEAETKKFRREFKREIKEYGDVMEEPDLGMFSKTFDSYVKEAGQHKDRLKNQKMVRKHFKHVVPKEICLLTWAEKENIRYLCETDAEQWTPEAIAQAYPISPDGVQKLCKSKLRLKMAKDVKSHDEAVAQKLADIKAGKIPITAELEERLKIRDSIPVRIGDLGMGADQFVDYSFIPKVPGEFAKLVAPPPKDNENSSNDARNEDQKFLTDGSYYEATDESGKDRLKIELSKEEFTKIIPTTRRMTFSQFESKMRKADTESLSADMKYMLSLNTNDSKSVESQESTASNEIELPVQGNVNFPSKMEKYKSPEETGKLSVSVEGGEGYIYNQDTGYQKPYDSGSSKVPQRISIPEHLWKPGATYKVGDCYYDEDGEFLYRVL